MIPTLIATAMLFGCFIEALPYGYFQILRWVVCGACAYRAFLCLESEHEKWMWIFIVAGILFNPIIPIRLDREVWLLIDGALGITMLVSLAILKKTESKHQTTDKFIPNNIRDKYPKKAFDINVFNGYGDISKEIILQILIAKVVPVENEDEAIIGLCERFNLTREEAANLLYQALLRKP